MFGLYGILGLILTFLIFVSVHEATSPNWVYSYQFVNFALLILLAVIFLCGIQSPNPAFYPLMAADAMRALAYILTFKHRNNKLYA